MIEQEKKQMNPKVLFVGALAVQLGAIGMWLAWDVSPHAYFAASWALIVIAWASVVSPMK